MFAMYCKVIVLSVQKQIRSTGWSVSRMINLYIRAPVSAALSSNRGRVTDLMGESLDFANTNLDAWPPS